jgi:hypothetical protein
MEKTRQHSAVMPMKRPVFLCALTFAAFCGGGLLAQEVTPGSDAAIDVPSGQMVSLLDVIHNEPGPVGLTLRFRFLAPAIADAVAFETAAADMAFLCDAYVLPRIAEFGPTPEQIIISFADRAIPFGQAAPDAVQFFESYRIENGTCQWEMF